MVQKQNSENKQSIFGSYALSLDLYHMKLMTCTAQNLRFTNLMQINCTELDPEINLLNKNH